MIKGCLRLKLAGMVALLLDLYLKESKARCVCGLGRPFGCHSASPKKEKVSLPLFTAAVPLDFEYRAGRLGCERDNAGVSVTTDFQVRSQKREEEKISQIQDSHPKDLQSL